MVRCATWRKREVHSTHPKYRSVHQFYVCPSAATWTRFPSCQFSCTEHVVFVGSDVLCTVVLPLVWCGTKQLRTFSVHLAAKVGRQRRSCTQRKTVTSLSLLYMDEKSMVCRKESMASMWTEHLNTFDLSRLTIWVCSNVQRK